MGEGETGRGSDPRLGSQAETSQAPMSQAGSSLRHALMPGGASLPAPAPAPSGWPLTVPQVSVSEVEGADEASEGVLCRAGLDLALHGRQLHVLQARPLGPGAPLRQLRRVGPA